MGAFGIKAYVGHKISLGVDGEHTVAEEMDLHLVVPIALLLFVALDLAQGVIPPDGFLPILSQFFHMPKETACIDLVEVDIKALPYAAPRSPRPSDHIMRKAV